MIGTHIRDRVVLVGADGVIVSSALCNSATLSIIPKVSVRGSGQKRVSDEQSSLVIDTYDQALVAQVRAWQYLRIPVRAFVQGDTTNDIFGEAVVPVVTVPGQSVLDTSNYIIELFYATQSAAVCAECTNLVAPSAWFAFAGGAFGSPWTVQAYTECSLGADGIATIDGSGGTPEMELARDFFCPLAGSTVTLSIDIVDDHPDANNERVRIQALDFEGGVLGTQTTNISGTGVKSVAITLPADTVDVRASFYYGEANSTGETKFRNPTLRLDGVATPIMV